MRDRSHYERIFRQGRVWRDGALVLRVLPNGLDRDRLGLVVTRRHGHAPARNRLRRLCKEAFRLERPAWPAASGGLGVDLVLSPVAGRPLDLAALRAALTALILKALPPARRGCADTGPPPPLSPHSSSLTPPPP